jgi:hypothetical protein
VILDYINTTQLHWDCKIYDKDGNRLVSSEDNGSVAYVVDKDGKTIWSADAQ